MTLVMGQRPGAFAVYLEPWHSDVFDFLELKKNTGKEEQRARDLFFALWIPDLFMKRVESNQVTKKKTPVWIPFLKYSLGDVRRDDSKFCGGVHRTGL